MGYTTEFKGKFKLSKPLEKSQIDYIQTFCKTRRMVRDEKLCEGVYDPIRLAVGLPIGQQGEFCVFGAGFHGQDHDDTIIEYNCHPSNQHGLWCKWTCTDDGNYIQWSDSEKFYSYFEWLVYICNNILNHFEGRYLEGTVFYQGEEEEDYGSIVAYPDKIELYSQDSLTDTIYLKKLLTNN